MHAKAGPASAAHQGSAGRRKTGQGENFWQYRGYNAEDSASRVDWRKSSRGDQLFVRETEMETTRTFLFWCDPSDGFDWRGSEDVSTKAGRALSILMALGSSIAKSGDRCGALGGPRAPSSGGKAALSMAQDLWQTPAETSLPVSNKNPATLVLASDFYRPMERLSAWIKELAHKNRNGTLLMVYDPIEASYPYEGRIRFFNPSAKKDRLIGRAENLKEEYLKRFQQRRDDMQALAHSVGWNIVFHQSDEPAAPVFMQISNWLEMTRQDGKKPA